MILLLTLCTESAISSSYVSKNQRSKRNFWWNGNCNEVRNRNRFWYHLWCSLGWPRDGAVYKTYKYSKYNIRRECRTAVNSASQVNFKRCDMFLSGSVCLLFGI